MLVRTRQQKRRLAVPFFIAIVAGGLGLNLWQGATPPGVQPPEAGAVEPSEQGVRLAAAVGGQAVAWPVPSFAWPATSEELLAPVVSNEVAARVAEEAARAGVKRYQAVMVDGHRLMGRVARGEAIRLKIGGRDHQVSLEENDLRAPGFKVTVQTDAGEEEFTPAPPTTYKGVVADDPGAVVRFDVRDGQIDGYVRGEDYWTFIRPVSALAPGSGASPWLHVVFDARDAADPTKSCGFGDAGGAVMEAATSGDGGAAAAPETAYAGTLLGADLAYDADYEYYSLWGSASATVSRIQQITNNIDGIYQRDCGITFNVTFINVWATSGDPYSQSGASALLDQFRSYWQGNMGSVQRDLAHLMTGRQISGSVIGIAWLGVVCDSFAYGLSSHGSLVDVTVAHEIGHNFNAPHHSSDTIMNPYVGPWTAFHSSSSGAIRSYAENASCVTPAGTSSTISFAQSNFTVVENQATATITVARGGYTGSAVSVNYATSNGSATAGSDYTAASGTLNFAVGQASRTFNVPILLDSVFEANETVNLTLSNPSGGASLTSPSTATLTINDYSAGKLEFANASFSVNENAGSAAITVRRVNGDDGVVTVQYATSNGTATAPADYAAVSGTLTFNNLVTTQTFNVPVVNDLAVEPVQTVNLAVSNPGGGGGLGTQTTAVLNIGDPPPTAVISANPTSGIVPLAVAFNGSASTPFGPPIVSYLWEFGDGATATTVAVNHTYVQPSFYTAKLTVTDSNNRAGTATVTIQADGIDLAMVESTSEVTGAGNYKFTSKVTNFGTLTTPTGFTNQYYLSTDAVLDAGDELVWTQNRSSTLAPGASWSYSTSFPVYGRDAGTYYGFSVADSGAVIQETDEANNFAPAAAVVFKPNLFMGGTNLSVSTDGRYITANPVLKNAGPSWIKESVTVGVYLSTDSVISPGDIYCGSIQSAGTLDSDDTYQQSRTFPVPLGTAPGLYYVGVIADPFGSIDEWDETDNDAKKSGTETIAGPGNQNPIADLQHSATPTTTGTPVTFDASASSDVDGVIAAYSWNFGDGSTGSGATVNHAFAYAGDYIVSLTVTDDGGATDTISTVISVSGLAPPVHLEFAVSGVAEDLRQKTTTGTVTNGAGLIFGYLWHNGIRFDSVTVPQGATITAAYLKVYPGTGRTNVVTLQYTAEASDDAATIPETTGALMARPRVSPALAETPAEWASGVYNNSRDLSPVIQAVVNRLGWASGNAMNVFVLDTGTNTQSRNVKSYNSNPDQAPILVIEYLP